jgi:hypothetical protein
MIANRSVSSGLCLSAAAVLVVASLPDEAFGRQARVDVCHLTGNGSYNLITVSESALDAHVRHGDGQPGDAIPDGSGWVFGEDCSPEPPQPTITQGNLLDPEEGSVRYRQQNSGGEIYLGVADLGVGANRVERGCTWADGIYEVKFSFNGTDTISTDTDNGGCSGVPFDYTIAPTCNTGSWNAMDIQVVDRSNATGISFENVDLEGFALGNFGAFDVPGTPGFQDWTIQNFDFSQAWTLVGDLHIQNFSGSAENNKLQIAVGCAP